MYHYKPCEIGEVKCYWRSIINYEVNQNFGNWFAQLKTSYTNDNYNL